MCPQLTIDESLIKGLNAAMKQAVPRLPKADPVRKPSHYALDGLDIEAIDVIRSVLGPERFQGYCRGNEIKYLLRADHKNGTEDLEKAQVYLGWEIQSRKEQHEEDNE